MSLFHHLKRILVKHLVDLRWYTLAYATLAYVVASWCLLYAFNEADLVAPGNFFYWLLVTASTVGYGDFSPQTAGGKWIVALFVIPVGLSLFAVLVGNLATYFAFQWRKGVKGLKQMHVENHILIIGWNGARTLRLVKLMLREQMYQNTPAPIVLCVTDDIENPFPEEVGFVKASSFTDDADMQRAKVDSAKCIILDNEQDDTTLATALYCHSKNPQAHTIAYFKDEGLAPLLKQHCPNIECTPSVAVEMIAKSATDPGSSLLHRQLLDVDEGMTQYSVGYPQSQSTKQFAEFFTVFKQRYESTLIGVALPSEEKITLNPPLEFEVPPGSTLYYIADERISQFDWSLCHV